MEQVRTLPSFNTILRAGLGVPIVLVLMLIMMILPLPAFILDLLFTFNIAISMIVLLAGVYCRRPLEFGVFPTILLVTTLLRLGLNVASTRVVLLNGHTGTDAAGKVVEAFGAVVVGGSYAVGIVVFAILVIINFVVVTKGAGRISEVSARFTLDAMPGKQMAIDADLNAGLITPPEAKIRREEVRHEADFYGAMDGASKFVRGDAVAGILILFINLIGGLMIGTLQHDMNLSDAMQNYSLLMIGDGLVAQIPSLLLSTSAAIMVTRVSSEQDFSQQIRTQMFNHPRPLYITSGVIGCLGIIPGMPHIAFLGLAALTAYLGKNLQERQWVHQQIMAAQEAEPVEAEAPVERKDISWEDVSAVDMIGLEIGYRLIPLVDTEQGGKLMDRVKGVRKKLSQTLGFLIPSVHIRDNLDLQPNNYRITMMGVTMGESEVHMDRLLAIDPGNVLGGMEGIRVKDPAFGLDALWIPSNQKDKALSFGYTVVDPSTVIATHLSNILQENSAELLGHDEVQQMLERLKQTSPKLVDELIPDKLPLSTVVRVLQNLLTEDVPIRDIRSITECLAESVARTRDPDSLTALVRIALARQIVQHINGMKPDLAVVTLNHDLERLLQKSVQLGGDDNMGLEPGLAAKLQSGLTEWVRKQEMQNLPPILLVPGPLRAMLARFARFSVPHLKVLSFQEVPDNKQLRVMGSVG